MTCDRELHRDLNVEQHEAVHFREGPVVLAAAAGSGKTRVTTYRIEQLVADGVDPQRIGAFTFANDAAGELGERLGKLGVEGTKTGTIHSLCYEILREDGPQWGGNFKVDEKGALLYALKDVLNRELKRPEIDAADLAGCIALAKANCLPMHPSVADEYEPEVTRHFQRLAEKPWLASVYTTAYRLFERARIERGLITFDDMLLLGWLTLIKDPAALEKWRSRFDYLIVDEAQDSSRVQNRVALLLAEPALNLMLVGDCQQCVPGSEPVVTPTGLRPVRTLAPGDLVLSRVRQAVGAIPVLQVARTRPPGARGFQFTLTDGSTFRVTEGHTCIVCIGSLTGWEERPAHLLGRRIKVPVISSSHHRWGAKAIKRVERVVFDEPCYDIEVAKPGRNYFLNGVAVHNSIYRWRGADPEEFVDFARRFTLIRLPTNYRSTVQICEYATNLTRGEPWNVTGETRPAEDAIDSPRSALATGYRTVEEEAEGVVDAIRALQADGAALGEIAVLYRVTSLLPPVEDTLLKARIPYRVWSGTSFYGRKEVKDLLAYLKVGALRDPDESEVKRTIHAPFRFLGKAFVEACAAYAAEQQIAFLDALARCPPPRPSQATRALELHRVLVECNRMIVAGTRPLHVLNFINDRTGYLAWLRREDGQAAPDPDGGRAAHVHQLLRVAEAFDNVNAFLDYIAIMDGALRAARGQRSKEAVVLSTIHRYKGLEANYVFGIGWNDGILPHALNPDPGEELRLAYVCLTRARRRFECSFVESAISVKGRLRARPSPFIEKAGIPFKDMQIRKVAP